MAVDFTTHEIAICDLSMMLGITDEECSYLMDKGVDTLTYWCVMRERHGAQSAWDAVIERVSRREGYTPIFAVCRGTER